MTRVQKMENKGIFATLFHAVLQTVKRGRIRHFSDNIMGDKFWREISALIYNFTCEIIKLPWQRFVPRWRSRFKDVMDEFTSS